MDNFVDKEQKELILCYCLAVLVLLLPAKLLEFFLLWLVGRRCILRPALIIERIFCELVRSSVLLTMARSARWPGAAAAAAVGCASAPFWWLARGCVVLLAGEATVIHDWIPAAAAAGALRFLQAIM